MNNNTVERTFSEEFIASLTYDTPYFLFSRTKLEENFFQFQSYFPNAHIQYAMKANSDPEVLKVLAQNGSGFEVASVGELAILKDINVDARKIVFGTSVKPASSIRTFHEYGVDRYAADSYQELEKIAANAPGAKVYIRTVANDAGSVFKFSEKFGTPPQNAVQLLIQAKELGLQPYGISFHVGSQASDPMAWANAIRNLVPIIAELQEKGIRITVLNLGGGYPCRYASSENVPVLSEIVQNINDALSELPYFLEIMLEPGRGMIADTAVLVASVIARIERTGNTWLFLDAGVYNGLFETMAYQGSTRYAVSSVRKVGDGGESMFALAGPTGDSPDVITREALLPSDIQVGDKLVFHNTGAYSLSVTSQFNGFSKPDSYLI